VTSIVADIKAVDVLMLVLVAFTTKLHQLLALTLVHVLVSSVISLPPALPATATAP